MLLRCLKRGVGSATVVLAVSGVAWLPSVSAARTVRPTAQAAATTCKLPGEGRTLGATYVEKLTVSGTTCTTGISLIKQYNACRKKAGGAAGKCTKTIMGYRFTEKRQSSPIAFIALVTAKNGTKAVNFTYTQNTA
jgi:hypothetical protein